MKYIKELDAIRGLAILSVIVEHWFPLDSIGYKIADIINAPNIFFTLSGFLITGILIRDKRSAESTNINK